MNETENWLYSRIKNLPQSRACIFKQFHVVSLVLYWVRLDGWQCFMCSAAWLWRPRLSGVYFTKEVDPSFPTSLLNFNNGLTKLWLTSFSELLNRYFLTWLLIGCQLCCQPIWSQVWNFLLNNINLTWIFLCNPSQEEPETICIV